MSEPELLKGCQRNDPKSQTALYNLYKSRLMGVCRRYAKNTTEAQDILQEAFIRIFTNINELKDEKAVAAWMRKVVANTAVNYYRANLKRQQSVDYETVEKPNDDQWRNYWELMSRLSTEQIVQLIHALPDGYRMVFNLCVIDGYDHAEIAVMLGISENTSRSQLFKAREMLRKKLKELGIVNYEKHA